MLLSYGIGYGLGPALTVVVYPSVAKVRPKITLPKAYSIPLPPVNMYAAGDAGTGEDKLDKAVLFITYSLVPD